jgi:hypothetical protein
VIAVLLLAAVSPTAATPAEPTYSDEQIERCGANVEHVKKIEAKTFALPQDKAVAVDEARKYLHMCLEIAAAQPFDAAQRAARRKCPCKEGDLEWNDEEAKDCRLNIEQYFRYPGAAEFKARQVDEIRSCVLKSRATRARIAQLEEEARAAALAPPAPPILSSSEADEAETNARLADRGFVKTWLTVRACYIAQDKKHTKKMLDAEMQGARIGGVIDKREVHERQEEFVVLDRALKAVQAELKAAKAKLGKCPPEGFQEISDCIDGDRNQMRWAAPDDDEYQSAADGIAEAARRCTPWERLTPEAGERVTTGDSQ